MDIAISAPTDIHALAHFSGVSIDGIAPGLGSTATTPLIIELVKRGHHVTVFTLSSGLDGELEYNWGNLRVFVGRSRRRHLARNFYKQEIAYLEGKIRSVRPQFVHAHWTYEFSLGALRANRPAVITVHDLPWNVLRYFRDPYRTVRLFMAYEVAFRGDNFTAVSEDSARHFRRYFKPGAQVRVIPNGLPNSLFEFVRPNNKKVRNFTFATILQGWTSRKNPTAALEAFAQVLREMPEAELIMFGFGYGPGEEAELWAKKHGFNSRVTFVGAISHDALIRRVVENVDAVIHPSLDEALSVTAIESLALGLVFIAGRSTPGMREILEDGRCGILVDVRNPDSIADAMLKVANDSELRDRTSSRGKEHARSKYRMSTVVAAYESVYEQMRDKGTLTMRGE